MRPFGTTDIKPLFKSCCVPNGAFWRKISGIYACAFDEKTKLSLFVILNFI